MAAVFWTSWPSWVLPYGWMHHRDIMGQFISNFSLWQLVEWVSSFIVLCPLWDEFSELNLSISQEVKTKAVSRNIQGLPGWSDCSRCHIINNEYQKRGKNEDITHSQTVKVKINKKMRHNYKIAIHQVDQKPKKANIVLKYVSLLDMCPPLT